MVSLSDNITVDILVPMAGAGGVENVVNATAVYLNQHGFHVRVVQLIFNGNLWLEPGIDFYPILFNKKVNDLDELADLYAAFLQQYGVPAMVLTVTWPYLVLTAKKALAGFSVPCKVVSWLHGPLSEYDKYGAGGIECLRMADHHLCISRKGMELILKDMPSAGVSLIHNPVDFSKYTPHTGYNRDSHTLLFVGRLSYEKHVDTIIEAVALANSMWKLRIIGSGDMLDSLSGLAASRHIEEQVEFLGWKSNPWDFSGDVTALVLASEYEGFPLVAIESLANGIPVISTPVDGITELIKPGVNGYLYPMGDGAQLAQLLDYIADGSMPDIHPSNCVSSVTLFDRETALAEFATALTDILDRISVIIPCHNVENQIRRCLDSILSQTIDNTLIEIICVDDCSTDGTLDILKEYEAASPDCFIIIPLSENRRQGYARNLALSYASGNYITYVDADDCMDAHMLEQLYNFSRIYNSDITECGYEQFNDTTGIPSAASSGSIISLHMSRPDEKKWYVLNRYWKTAPWGRLYRKSFLTDNNIMFAEGFRMEDILFSAQCMKYMDTYVLIPASYYFYYENPQGTMFGSKINEYYMDTASVQNMATDFLRSFSWYDDCYEEYSYIHYTKAFEEPIWRMAVDASLFSYENIMLLKNELISRFPDICDNKYLISNIREDARICLMVLRHNLSREQLEKVFIS